MTTTPTLRTGVVLCALMGALDFVSFFASLIWPGPPFAIALAVGVVGAVTLAGTLSAWRGGRNGVITVVVSRVLAIVLAAGVYVAPEAPMWAVWATTATIVVMVAGMALIVAGLRRTEPVE